MAWTEINSYAPLTFGLDWKALVAVYLSCSHMLPICQCTKIKKKAIFVNPGLSNACCTSYSGALTRKNNHENIYFQHKCWSPINQQAAHRTAKIKEQQLSQQIHSQQQTSNRRDYMWTSMGLKKSINCMDKPWCMGPSNRHAQACPLYSNESAFHIWLKSWVSSVWKKKEELIWCLQKSLKPIFFQPT